jgi:hypothetical protein
LEIYSRNTGDIGAHTNTITAIGNGGVTVSKSFTIYVTFTSCYSNQWIYSYNGKAKVYYQLGSPSMQILD